MSVLSMKNVAKVLDIKLSTLADLAFMHLLVQTEHYELEDPTKISVEDWDSAENWIFTVKGLLKISKSLPEEKYEAIGKLIACHEIEKSGIFTAAQNILSLSTDVSLLEAGKTNNIPASANKVKTADIATSSVQIKKPTKTFGAITHPELYNLDENGMINTKDGMKFSSVKELVTHYNLKNVQVVYDGIYAHKNINDIIWAKKKKKVYKKQNINDAAKNQNTNPARQGAVKDSDTLRLWGWDSTSQSYIAPNGKHFSSIDKMCNEYGLIATSVRYHIQRGKSFKDVVNAIKKSRKAPESFPVKPSSNKKVKVLTKEGLPELSDTEADWIKRMDKLMDSSKLKSIPANKIRYAVYQRMRNVYGIVLTQAMHDYMETWKIDAKTHCSYYYMVAQTPKLASLFEAILTDMSKDGIPA